MLLAEAANNTIGWPGAILGIGVAFAAAFALWALCKYGLP